MKTDRPGYADMMELLNKTWTAWNPLFNEMKTDLEYYLGHQISARDRAYLEYQGRKVLVINGIRRLVHLLGGYQRQNRLDINFKVFASSASYYGEQLSQLASIDMDKDKGAAHAAVARIFGAKIKSGMSWMNIYPDFSIPGDFLNREIKFKAVKWHAMLPDPLFSELDMSDAAYLFRVEKLTPYQAKLFLPGIKKGDLSTAGEDKFNVMSNRERSLISSGTTYTLIEHWKREKVRAKYLLDSMTGQTMPLKGMPRERIGMLMGLYPQLVEISKPEEDVTLDIWLGEDKVYSGPDPTECGDIPYVPDIAYWDPEYEELKWKLQGVVRPLRDPQDERNKRRMQILHAINTMVLSGWKYEEGALADERQMDNASGAGVKLKTKAGRLGDVEQLQGRNIPGELFKLEEALANDNLDISGINAELMATVDKDMPGVTVNLRQRQSLTAIEDLFDNHRIFKQGVGGRYEKIAQKVYTPQRVMELLEQEPAPEWITKQWPKTEAIADENPDTKTQREFNFQKLVEYHRSVHPVHPMIMFEMADFPEKYKPLQAQFIMANMQAALAAPQQQGPQQQGGQRR